VSGSALVVGMVIFSRAKTKVEREALRVQRDAAIQHVEMVGDYVGGFTPKLKPWWSELEREAFGYNDNERWIRETDRILMHSHQPVKQAQWDELTGHVGNGPAILEAMTADAAPPSLVTVDIMALGQEKPLRTLKVVGIE
jgi:hypothetical protein